MSLFAKDSYALNFLLSGRLVTDYLSAPLPCNFKRHFYRNKMKQKQKKTGLIEETSCLF